MKKLLVWLYWILQIIAFIVELIYMFVNWGVLGLIIGFILWPIVFIVLPFYMLFASGIWFPLATTILAFILAACSTFIDKK